MTAYSVLHLVLAAVCAAMALVHFALWVVVRADRVQLWVAISFVGFCCVTLAIAGSGVAAGGLGDTLPWIAIGTLAIPFLWAGPLLTAWHMVGHKVGRGARAMLGFAVALGIARMLDVAAFITRAEAGTWEMAFNTLATPTVLPAWGMTLLVGGTCIYEAARDLGRRSPAAWVLLLTAIPATLLVVREVGITVGAIKGPTWLALTGLPFLFTASAIVALRYAQAMRGIVRNEELSGYRLVRRLEAGGMGELYVATRVGPGGFARLCALKKMLLDEEDSAEMLERFLAEARLAAQLDHPNIVAVHDVGRLGDGGWFIAMEYLTGVTLSQLQERLRARRMAVPIAFVLRVGEQVCRGLSFAHGQGVVHRDVSPQNVMVTFRGEVKVIDFGIAIERGKRGMTGAGLVIGKGPYLAPERIAGMPAEPSSDLFALGVVLYELLVGIRPFAGRSPTDLSRAIQNGAYVSMRDLRPEIPQALEAIVDRALRSSPAERWPTAEAFGDALAVVARTVPAVNVEGWIREIAEDAIQVQRRADVFAGVRDDSTRHVAVRLT